MLLGKIIQRVNARRRVVVDYADWLQKGEQVSGVVCTVDQGTAAVDTITLAPDRKSVSFFLANGTIGDLFNIIVQADTNYTSRRYDTVQVMVETNGGATILSGQTALMVSIIGPTGPSGGPTGPTGPIGP